MPVPRTLSCTTKSSEKRVGTIWTSEKTKAKASESREPERPWSAGTAVACRTYVSAQPQSACQLPFQKQCSNCEERAVVAVLRGGVSEVL